jgi:transposase-like protein
MIKIFRCPFCENTFQLDGDKLSQQGSKGTCMKCKNNLVVFPDGRTIKLSEWKVPVTPPEKKEDPSIWQIRLKATGTVVPGGPFNLAQILQFVLEDKVIINDEAMIEGTTQWLPLKAISAMDNIFREKVLKDREKYGDEDHCVDHKDLESRWFCPKCKCYFCKDCSVNKPFVEGGAPHYMCKNCDMDLLEVKKKSKGLTSLLGLKK